MPLTNYIEMDLDQWIKEYRPIQNHIVINAPYDGTMFETYGDELAFVRNQPPTNIWTMVSNDEDDECPIIDGFHFVNRLGYFITEKPAPSNHQFQIN